MRRLSFLESLSDSLAGSVVIRELKWSELGRQIAVDLKADADFDEGRGRPSHDFLLGSSTHPRRATLKPLD
jgi:hypothetical protein